MKTIIKTMIWITTCLYIDACTGEYISKENKDKYTKKLINKETEIQFNVKTHKEYGNIKKTYECRRKPEQLTIEFDTVK